MTPHSWSSDSSQISACAASSNQWAIHSKGAGRVSEDFTGGWSGSSSIIAPPLSLLDPRSSGTNKAIGTLLKMAQTNQLPVIPSPRSEEMKHKRSETHPIAQGFDGLYLPIRGSGVQSHPLQSTCWNVLWQDTFPQIVWNTLYNVETYEDSSI